MMNSSEEFCISIFLLITELKVNRSVYVHTDFADSVQ